MKLDRRTILKGAGALVGSLPLGAAVSNAATQITTPPVEVSAAAFEFSGWPELRREFDLDFQWSNFAGFLLASRPRMVEQDIAEHRTGLNRNPANYLRVGYGIEEHGRIWAGKYFGVSPRQVSLTNSTTMGLATLYNNISIKPGQEILSTEHEHYSSITSLKYRSEREGFKVNTIRLYDQPQDASVGEMLERLRNNINDRTRVLALTWVHSGSSVKLPVAEVGKLVKELNRDRDEDDRILYCVDGVHGFGVENMNFDEMGCDYFVAGTHKWMFGPSGTGIMVSKETNPATISPTIPPFNLAEDPSFAGTMTPGGFHSFENRWALRKAFEFHLLLGKDRVQSRIHYLNQYLKERLDDTKGVELATPMSDQLSAGFTFFKVPKLESTDVEKIMFENKIALSATNRDAGPIVRMAPGLLNSTQEIDGAVELLRKIS